MSTVVHLQVSVNGYQGEAVTLYGTMMPAKGKLLIDREGGGLEDRKEDHVKCSNLPGGDISIQFKDDFIRDAIQAWMQMKGSNQVRLAKKPARHDPSTRLQTIRVSEKGPVYEIGTDVNNGQMAVLIMCWLARKQVTHSDVANFSQMVAHSLYNMEILR